MLSYNVVQGNNPEDIQKSSSQEVKQIFIHKNGRGMISFPFNFEVGEVADTVIRNYPTPTGLYSEVILYQLINAKATQQLSFKIMSECLVNRELMHSGLKYLLEVKEEYEIAFLSDENLVVCRLVS